jgi:hypothetical protein
MYNGLEPSEITISLMKFGLLGPREFLWRVRDFMTKWKAVGGGKKSICITHRAYFAQIVLMLAFLSHDTLFWYSGA